MASYLIYLLCISWFTGTRAEQMLNQALYSLWAIALDKAKQYSNNKAQSQMLQRKTKPGLRQYKTQARQFREKSDLVWEKQVY